MGGANDGKPAGALKETPIDGCYRRIRRERLLGKSAEDSCCIPDGLGS
jgi:hypothetical protein